MSLFVLAEIEMPSLLLLLGTTSNMWDDKLASQGETKKSRAKDIALGSKWVLGEENTRKVGGKRVGNDHLLSILTISISQNSNHYHSNATSTGNETQPQSPSPSSQTTIQRISLPLVFYYYFQLFCIYASLSLSSLHIYLFDCPLV